MLIITKEQHSANIGDTINNIHNVLKQKGEEYDRKGDPIHTFNQVSSISGQHPTKTLDGMLLKQYSSYRDMLDDIQIGILPTKEMIEEKFDDILTYFLIQKSLFLATIASENALKSEKKTAVLFSDGEPICVYAVPVIGSTVDPVTLTDEEFKLACTKTFSLPAYQLAVNNGSFDSSEFIIRFIK